MDHLIGAEFKDRRALMIAGLHRHNQAGICNSRTTGEAESIVLSGGYEDDEDHGEWIIYTGQGGNDPNTGRQVADQALTRGNLGLAKSAESGNPVRVIRGWKHKHPSSPKAGYLYSGLYRVADYWHERGKSGS